jgi:Fur family zinc uptake transcriptional regulator
MSGRRSRLDRRAVDKALHKAEVLCQQRGVRLTPRRRRALELILTANQPVGAYTLLSELKSGAKMGPPTIYRALDFLLEQKFIHRVVSLNAFIACIDLDHPHQGQFVICTKCGSTAEIHAEQITSGLNREGRALGFKVEHQVIELSGLCTRCQA